MNEVRYLKAKHDAALHNDTKVIKQGGYVVYVLQYDTPKFAIAKCALVREDGIIVTDDGRLLSKLQCFPYGTPIDDIIKHHKTTYNNLSLNDRITMFEKLGVVFENKDLIAHHSNLKIWRLDANSFGTVNSYLITLEEVLNMITPAVEEDKFDVNELRVTADISRLLVLLHGIKKTN